MISSVLAISLAASNSLNVELVQNAATMLARGQNPFVLEGVRPRTQEEIEELPSLAGCSTAVVDGSNKINVQIDYTCSNGEGKYVHRVAFVQHEDGQMSIHVDPLGTALGPTDAALSSERLPSMSRQVKMLGRAARRGEDVTLDGIIPLTSEQIFELAGLSHCKWDEPVSFGRRQKEWFAFVDCPEFERNRGRMVEVDFDDERRVITVRVAHGAKVRRGG